MHDDEWDDDDWPDDDESAEVVPCPSCGGDVYEDAEQCPHCGQYVTHDRPPLEGKPVWFLLLGLAGIIAVIVLLAGLGPLLF
ncbi:MAG TPA: hypothetical protein VML55_19510 [Planctomycetaceae bacterium]|nr:hypothetical protein [Planctomycetaceae bacterium]